MESWTQWINRTETKEDFISPLLVRRMSSIMGTTPPKEGEPLPHLWHWMFFQPELPANEIGRDGHPSLDTSHDAFMPPIVGRNRMWAGGAFEFHTPLSVGQPATCRTTIENIVEKEGDTGSLIFVTLRHDYLQKELLCLIERQTLVYREPSKPKTTSYPAPTPDWLSTYNPDATLLFRYSAVTYNGHRIHYDYPYATQTEGYEHLVVHGPMMATWALHSFLSNHPDKNVTHFSFRGVRPTTVPHPLHVGGRLTETQQAEVWVSNDAGVIQKGSITYE